LRRRIKHLQNDAFQPLFSWGFLKPSSGWILSISKVILARRCGAFHAGGGEKHAQIPPCYAANVAQSNGPARKMSIQENFMSKQIESAAYHEAGHVTAAIVQGMPIRVTGLHVDLYGHGCADYFERGVGDLALTELDHRERKLTIIALYTAHEAQLRFYPECLRDGWQNDLAKIEGLTHEMHLTDEEAHAMQGQLKERAKKLVDDHWPIIEELAKTLLAKTCTPMLPEDAKWGIGPLKRHMPGTQIVEFFAKHNIRAKIVADDVRKYDSTQDAPPPYDSLA
jgi:hypothetical protein